MWSTIKVRNVNRFLCPKITSPAEIQQMANVYRVNVMSRNQAALIQALRRIHLRDIAQELDICIGSEHNIVYGKLGFRKTYSLGIAHPTIGHKTTRIALFLQHLMWFQADTIPFRTISYQFNWRKMGASRDIGDEAKNNSVERFLIFSS